MEIAWLADHPELAPTIAAWHWAEWGHTDPGGSLEAWTAGIAKRARRGEIPTTLVAFVDGELAGSTSLVEYDMDIHRDLTPWVSGVYVAPEYRGSGVGTRLIRAAEDAAASIGVGRLYLYTSSAEPFYARLGWETIRHDRYGGESVAIMAARLAEE